MNLKQLMEKVEHYNEIAEMIKTQKIYVRFDGFHRVSTKKEMVQLIETNYLNHIEILESEMLIGADAPKNEFAVCDDGFEYEVIVFNGY